METYDKFRHIRILFDYEQHVHIQEMTEIVPDIEHVIAWEGLDGAGSVNLTDCQVSLGA